VGIHTAVPYGNRFALCASQFYLYKLDRTGVSAPCSHLETPIWRFQTPVCVISAEIPDKNSEICLPACCMHDTPAITPAMATHAPVAAV
jgi:hypothetical protein